MARRPPRTPEEMSVSPLAARLIEWGQANGMSPRGMSVAAGLAPDAIRNLTRKASFRPSARTLSAFAKLMRVPVEVLMDPTKPMPEPSPAPDAAAAPAKPYRTFAPPPTPVEEVFNETELLILASLGIQVEVGPKVWIPEPETGGRVNLARAWMKRDGIRKAVLQHVEGAASALREAMAEADRPTPYAVASEEEEEAAA